MTMERITVLIFLCTAVEGDIGKHIFISTQKNWLEAQAYCRQHYTDLSFVISQSDQDKLLEAAGDNCRQGWIGLHQRPDNITAWMWSGGANVTYQNWANGQPDNRSGQEYAGQVLFNGKWIDCNENDTMPFYCINIPILKVKKSWEDALEHCRENDNDLPSLLSDTDLLQVQKMIQLDYITDPVWIGLRYLNDHWLWVNGNPLVYEAWPQGDDEDYLCPMQKRCGALTKTERWKNWDCQDELNFICI